MKPIVLILPLLIAACATQQPSPLPSFPECPGLLPTPAPIGKHEKITDFEIRIELSREESVKRHTACLAANYKLREWIAQHR